MDVDLGVTGGGEDYKGGKGGDRVGVGEVWG